MKPVIFVGQAPPRRGGPPLRGGRLSQLMRRVGDGDEWVDRVNLLSRWPGKARSGKGDAFPKAEARKAWLTLERKLKRGRPKPALLVFIGKGTAGIAGVRGEPFVMTRREWVAVSWVPHPSGVNRFWNDPEAVIRAVLFLEMIIKAAMGSKLSDAVQGSKERAGQAARK